MKMVDATEEWVVRAFTPPKPKWASDIQCPKCAKTGGYYTFDRLRSSNCWSVIYDCGACSYDGPVEWNIAG